MCVEWILESCAEWPSHEMMAFRVKKKKKKEDICIHKFGLLHHKAETNTTIVKQLYFNKKIGFS